MNDIKVLLTQENPFLSKLEDDAHSQAKKIGMHGPSDIRRVVDRFLCDAYS